MTQVTVSIVFHAALFFLLASGGLARAGVVTTGDVDPGGAGPHSNPWVIRSNLYVGNSGVGTLSVTDSGVVSGFAGYIANSATATGVATIRESGSHWKNSSTLSVGRRGSGALNVESGGLVSNTLDGHIGHYLGSTGIAKVTGSGSQWNNSDDLWIGGHFYGNGGSGTLNIYNSGLVTVSDITKLWSTGTLHLDGGSLTTGSFDNSEAGAFNFEDGTLTVNGAGGSFNPGIHDFQIDGDTASDLPHLVITNTAIAMLSGSLSVGSSEQGSITVESGSVVSNAKGFIGRFSQSTGESLVSGSGSQWNNSSDLYVGEGGSGTLNITDRGVVSNTTGYIGYHSFSTGQATISGSDSQWNNSGDLIVGRFNLANGTLSVESGGTVSNINGVIGQEPGATGVVTVNGSDSQWNNSSDLYVGRGGTGTLNVTDGGLVFNHISHIGSESNSIGEVIISGANSQWSNSDVLVVGRYGSGTLNITDGGTVSNTDGYIAERSGSTSMVTVSGLGSQWNNSSWLFVGSTGNGTLNITNGGVVSSIDSWISDYSNSTSVATVSGSGSKWNNSIGLYVGENGSGTLSVEAGGVVSNSYGYIGNRSGATGVATITGSSSQWNNSGYLYVGSSGTGTLNVESGGVVSNTYSYIGKQPSATGLVTVTGSGSHWNNSDDLSVGKSGNGTLNVEDGGVVSNGAGFIGHLAGSTGETTVTGFGSQWNNLNNLAVGSDGSGTLNIEPEGLVTVGGITSIGTDGEVNLMGGRFEFRQTTLVEFSMINATGGAMAGNVNHSGYTDVSTLTALQNNAVDLTDVTLTNSGVLYGDASLGNALINTKSGEVEIADGERMRFGGTGNTNAGEINNFGGMIRLSQDLTNEKTGFIGGRGQFAADGGWVNQGAMAFSGTTDILGDVHNHSSGQIITSAGKTTTIFDDLINDGTVKVSAGSTAVYFGSVSGSGIFTGSGRNFFEGDLAPGSSPGTMSFGGDVVLGATSTTQIELSGTVAGEYDQLDITGSISLASTLDTLLIDDFSPGLGDTFTIISADGGVTGTFDTTNIPMLGGGLSLDLVYHPTFVALEVISNLLLGDANNDNQVTGADLVIVQQNFGNVDPNMPTDGLFIGDTNDDGKVTGADLIIVQQNFGNTLAPVGAEVPEPTSACLLTLAGLGAMARRRPQ